MSDKLYIDFLKPSALNIEVDICESSLPCESLAGVIPPRDGGDASIRETLYACLHKHYVLMEARKLRSSKLLARFGGLHPYILS